MEEGGASLVERNPPFEQTKLNSAESIFVNQHDIKNTFPVVIENPLGMIQALPNTNRTQANMINEMTGYFSEYGNLTIFLDTSVINNENSTKLLNADVNMNDCYVVPDSTTIEKPFTKDAPAIKTDAVPAVTPTTMPKPIEFISVPSLVSDLPEYIDLDALAFSPSFTREPIPPIKRKVVPLDSKPIVKAGGAATPVSSVVGTNPVQNDDSDDEVIFVKEYRVGPPPPKVSVIAKPIKKCRVGPMPPLKKWPLSPKRCKAGTFVPRRNPKRKAQLQKNYDVDFEFDFSIAEDECNRTGDYGDDFSIRRSQRALVQPVQSFSSTSSSTTSSAHSPIPSEYMREWPVDGMHERPHYNPLTGDIEKFDHVPKPKSKTVTNQTRPVKKGKRRTLLSEPKKKPLTARQKLLEAERVTKEFAVLTHETFHDLIDYVKQFKRATQLIDKDKRHGDCNDKFNDDLQRIKDMLLDNSIFYCLANNVTQKDLAKYFVKGFKLSLNES